MLEVIFGGRVDVQIGSGYLNCINAYTAKASEGLNFSLKGHPERRRADTSSFICLLYTSPSPRD